MRRRKVWTMAALIGLSVCALAPIIPPGQIDFYSSQQLGVVMELPKEAKSLARGNMLTGKVGSLATMQKAGLPTQGVKAGAPAVFTFGGGTSWKLAIGTAKLAVFSPPGTVDFFSSGGSGLRFSLPEGVKPALRKGYPGTVVDPKKLALCGLKDAQVGDIVILTQTAKDKWRAQLLDVKHTAKLTFEDKKWEVVK